MKFLTAEWRKLVMFNYEVDPDTLKPYLPKETELDFYKGTCYVSLVGFMFLNTRVLGVSVPLHRNFEEVNLRFYVKRKVEGEWRRGVVFVKEIVPKPAITFVANALFKERYQTLPMSHDWQKEPNSQTIRYQWGSINEVSIKAGLEAEEMIVRSEEEFIAEHYWGYSQYGNQTFEYEVTHPKWKIYTVLDHQINVDFRATYGAEFEFLNHQNPQSVLLAEGSHIAVLNKTKL